MSKKQDSEFIKFVKKELDILSKDAENEKSYKELSSCAVTLCECFESLLDYRADSKKGMLLIRLFDRLTAWQPLTPLTGDVDEWIPIFDPKDETTDIRYMNKRCAHVYKRKDGTCFDSRGVTFSYDGKTWFRTKDSNIDISFPYQVPLQPKKVLLNKEDETEEEKPLS